MGGHDVFVDEVLPVHDQPVLPELYPHLLQLPLLPHSQVQYTNPWLGTQEKHKTKREMPK